jgi:hypothetical protein
MKKAVHAQIEGLLRVCPRKGADRQGIVEVLQVVDKLGGQVDHREKVSNLESDSCERNTTPSAKEQLLMSIWDISVNSFATRINLVTLPVVPAQANAIGL